ncbi:MAG: hypothetical protein ACI38Y_04030, partial [Candidatus Methanomethylophilaceae archaeon]
GRWYDVDGSILGFSIYEETDGYWAGSNGHFAPGAYESSFWIMIDGLSGVSNTDFRFRIDAVRQNIGSELHNPSLSVTAYKDTRIMDVGCSMMIGQTMTKDYGLFDDNGVRVVLIDDKSVYNVGGRMLVFVKTDLEPGERVELWHYNENNGFTMLNGDLHVYYDGYVIYDVENVSVDPEPYITIGAIVLLVLGLAFLIGFNIRRH